MTRMLYEFIGVRNKAFARTAYLRHSLNQINIFLCDNLLLMKYENEYEYELWVMSK